MTAPVGDVTTPTTVGRNGTLRLRAASNSPSSASFFAPRLEQRHQRAHAGELHRVDYDLVVDLPGKVVNLPVATTSSPSSGLSFSR